MLVVAGDFSNLYVLILKVINFINFIIHYSSHNFQAQYSSQTGLQCAPDNCHDAVDKELFTIQQYFHWTSFNNNLLCQTFVDLVLFWAITISTTCYNLSRIIFLLSAHIWGTNFSNDQWFFWTESIQLSVQFPF